MQFDLTNFIITLACFGAAAFVAFDAFRGALSYFPRWFAWAFVPITCSNVGMGVVLALGLEKSWLVPAASFLIGVAFVWTAARRNP